MRKNLPALTSLRFFAAAMIVVTHTHDFFHIGTELSTRLILTQGVSFFFVLSGFVLFYSHQDMVSSQRLTAGQFMWARFARVWPAHIVTMLAYCFIFIYLIKLEDPLDFGRTLINASLLQAWIPYPSYYFGFNGVAWSLSVEMFLYAMFPLLIARWNNTWHWKLALAALILIASTSIPGSLALPAWQPNYLGPTIASYTYIWPPAHLLEFIFGMASASLYVRYAGSLDRISKPSINAVEIVGMGLAIWALLEMPRIGYLIEAAGYADSGLRSWMMVSGASPFIAIMFFAMASGRGMLGKILAFRPLVMLGEISFSLYLVHQLVIRAWIINKDFASEYSDMSRYIGYWAFILVLSLLLWMLVEKPAQRLLTRKAKISLLELLRLPKRVMFNQPSKLP